MTTLTLNDIHIRDPFVLPVAAERAYYLFGTNGAKAWTVEGNGFECYRSRDLLTWEGPFPAFLPAPDFWATTNFWAPEVHFYRGRYYMFASFKAPGQYRATQILVADAPHGPYTPLTAGPITPPDWECLDGTLHVDQQGVPWIVFCHEWVQIHNGAIYAMPLTPDLTQPAGRPLFLFNASEAAWVTRPSWPAQSSPFRFPTYVTDGPFLYRTSNGTLLMLWSSSGHKGYALGVARSASGNILGPWLQTGQPLWEEDGGHGMIFQTFDGRLLVALHQPNQGPYERAHLFEMEDSGESIALK